MNFGSHSKLLKFVLMARVIVLVMKYEEKGSEEQSREEQSVGRRAVLELFIASPSDLLRGLEAI